MRFINYNLGSASNKEAYKGMPYVNLLKLPERIGITAFNFIQQYKKLTSTFFFLLLLYQS